MAVKVGVQTKSKRPVVDGGGVVSTLGRRTMTAAVSRRMLPALTELPSSDCAEADGLGAQYRSVEARRRVVS